ncbi:hypothetical protein FRZ06_05995 [Anoxybacterium hadale]|uniref:Uncharacterized protein n=1 Tax=Anoxybacterium hadale TaxID=3408580 RepID=A0ACD1A999_9FIRM|nr:hypothetical protein FRZ06_05995 [Clostridiales bacterium]
MKKTIRHKEERSVMKNWPDLKLKIDLWMKRLVILLPDWLTGEREIMQRKLRLKYGQKDCDTYILEEKKSLMKAYVILTATFFLLLILSIPQWFQENEELKSIAKPGPGETSVTVPVEAKMDYKGVEVSKSFQLRVDPKELSEEEKRRILQKFSEELPNRILGKNQDLIKITTPLNLIEYDRLTGITIVWASSNPEVIQTDGAVDLIAAEGLSTLLTAQLTLDGITREVDITAVIDQAVPSSGYFSSMEKRLDDAVDQLNENSAAEYIQLPERLPQGMEIRWQQKRESYLGMMAALYGFLLLILFLKRYEKIDKEMKAARESIEKDLPEFISKLVLLLNAGLVFSSAFSKIVTDYERHYQRLESGKNTSRKRHLYAELLEIQKRVEKTNSSLIFELKDFSQRSGVRDLVRLTAIISDNWNKGSALAEKMEREGELMWIGRKKKAEEKGRLAETKLTLPLMILLIVLIVITVAPALMEM